MKNKQHVLSGEYNAREGFCEDCFHIKHLLRPIELFEEKGKLFIFVCSSYGAPGANPANRRDWFAHLAAIVSVFRLVLVHSLLPSLSFTVTMGSKTKGCIKELVTVRHVFATEDQMEVKSEK